MPFPGLWFVCSIQGGWVLDEWPPFRFFFWCLLPTMGTQPPPHRATKPNPAVNFPLGLLLTLGIEMLVASVCSGGVDFGTTGFLLRACECLRRKRGDPNSQLHDRETPIFGPRYGHLEYQKALGRKQAAMGISFGACVACSLVVGSPVPHAQMPGMFSVSLTRRPSKVAAVSIRLALEGQEELRNGQCSVVEYDVQGNRCQRTKK